MRYERLRRAPFLPSVLCVVALLALSCGGGGGGGGGGDDEARGTISVTVLDGVDGSPIEGARVLVLEGDTGSPAGSVQVTDEFGQVEQGLAVGSVTVNVSAQGFETSPPPLSTALPVSISRDRTTSITVRLPVHPDRGDTGWVTGVVRNAGGSGLGGALVVVQTAAGYRSGMSAGDGSFAVHNVPPGAATAIAYKGGYNIAQTAPGGSLTVALGAETPDVVLEAEADAAAGSVQGKVTFLASKNSVVDVTVVHPGTLDVIPGLRTHTESSGNTYSLAKVPDGTFNMIASLASDGYVLDPDSVAKFGIPSVAISGAPVIDMNFDVTDSILLTEPVANAKVPAGQVVRFSWEKYPSAADYVIEVLDSSSVVIWGGFNPDGSKRFSINELSAPGFDRSAPFVDFDFDGSASGPLGPGQCYQVRIYASDDVSLDPKQFTLISSTEDLDGTFQVVQP